MAIQQLCPILSVQYPNDFAVSFVVDAGDMALTAQVGQFVHIKCGEGQLLRRPISICDVKEGTLRIVFEARGEGTQWLAQRKAGECLDIMGPLGHGFDLRGHKKMLLVGGGIGVPPMLYAARAMGTGAHVIMGFRDSAHAMLQDDFSTVADSVVVTSDDGSIGHHGFVDAQVEAALAAKQDFDGVLACGPKAMLRAVARVADKYGVPCQVSLEERMGCGVGACLVCACKTTDGAHKHVCKDGPVFDAKEVNWDD